MSVCVRAFVCACVRVRGYSYVRYSSGMRACARVQLHMYTIVIAQACKSTETHTPERKELLRDIGGQHTRHLLRSRCFRGDKPPVEVVQVPVCEQMCVCVCMRVRAWVGARYVCTGVRASLL